MVGRRSPQTPSINRLTSLPELGTLKTPEITSRQIPTHQATAPRDHRCRRAFEGTGCGEGGRPYAKSRLQARCVGKWGGNRLIQSPQWSSELLTEQASTRTKRASIGVTLALDHAAVGRERLVVHDDGAQIRLTFDYKDANAVKLRRASPYGKHHRAGLHHGVLLDRCVERSGLRECYDMPFESPVGLLSSSAGLISHSSTPSTSKCIRSPR